jgi:hypothetical protein
MSPTVNFMMPYLSDNYYNVGFGKVLLSLINLTLSLIDSSLRILFGDGIWLGADKCLFHGVDILEINIQKQHSIKVLYFLFILILTYHFLVHFGMNIEQYTAIPYNKSNCEIRHNKQFRQSVCCYRSVSVLDTTN